MSPRLLALEMVRERLGSHARPLAEPSGPVLGALAFAGTACFLIARLLVLA